ncbi:MAG: hypothetical protein L0212_06185 [Acidobacteria bacterium]|nr:hypothetical protein [Acidobacteriota bacterium]
MADCECPYCGKTVSDKLLQCPYCREGLSARPGARRAASGGRQGVKYIRRGQLYMLLAAACYYLFGGYSPVFAPPFSIEPWLTSYVLPILFMGGLGLFIFGVIRRFSG